MKYICKAVTDRATISWVTGGARISRIAAATYVGWITNVSLDHHVPAEYTHILPRQLVNMGAPYLANWFPSMGVYVSAAPKSNWLATAVVEIVSHFDPLGTS